MKSLDGKTIVITGAASGFGLATSRLAAAHGMKIVMADVQQDALDRAAAEIAALGADVLPFRLDVARAEQVEALGRAVADRFGAPHVVFNNAGVGGGGLVWEHTAKDWEWIVGVNLMGVAHGVRVFTPMMLEAARRDPGYEGHIVSKSAVVALSETLFQDLALVTDRIRCSVLCPFFVPTGIHHSERNRPAETLDAAAPTRSQTIAKALAEKAVSSGRLSAAEVAQMVMDAIAAERFYIFSHPKALGSVQTRLEDIMQGRNPGDPFRDRPQIGEALRAAMRGA
jgi:NAD(P)-dependent dehydrogenase (short-subunit alcohol dehydrogenase family)